MFKTSAASTSNTAIETRIRTGLWKSLAALAIAVLLVYWPLHMLSQRYMVAVDITKGKGCVPYKLFIVEKHDKAIHRGDYVAFYATKMEPFYVKGTRAIKIVAAIAGDHVVVDTHQVFVNGVRWGSMTHVSPNEKLWLLGKRPKDFLRDEVVPTNRIWVMGTDPRSYDSRYWGYVDESEIIGRAIPVW